MGKEGIGFSFPEMSVKYGGNAQGVTLVDRESIINERRCSHYLRF
jgi:hypothetical protein